MEKERKKKSSSTRTPELSPGNPSTEDAAA
jgi:hypothetical protein